VPVTTPSRTVLDLGCWYPTTSAVAAIDSLARATEIKTADVELLAQRYPGRRGIVRARLAITLFDAGAQSPKETWLRLVLINAGLPRPRTQIPVRDETGSAMAYLDMGWEDIKVAAEYDGDSTAPTDTNTTGMCGDRKYFTDSAGPSFVSWQVIDQRRSFDGSSPP
jgi:hypothetical protein